MKHLLLSIFCCFALLACDSPETAESPAKSTSTEESHEGHNHEAQSGESHAGHDHAMHAAHPDDDTARIQVLIQELAKTYGEPADSIATRTYRARYVLNDFGIEESALQILEAMSKAGRKEQKSYREAVLQYTMRRTQGNKIGGGN